MHPQLTGEARSLFLYLGLYRLSNLVYVDNGGSRETVQFCRLLGVFATHIYTPNLCVVAYFM